MLREKWTGDRGTAVPVAIHVIEMRKWLGEMGLKVSSQQNCLGLRCPDMPLFHQIHMIDLPLLPPTWHLNLIVNCTHLLYDFIRSTPLQLS